MRKLLLLAVIIITIICHAKVVKGLEVSIEDVYTEPNEPTDTEVITIVASGIGFSSPVFIDDSDFQMEGTSLELDILFTLGIFGMESPWSHSEVIGALSANDYDLTVRAYNYNDLTETYELSDTYLTEFTVVPEPATIVLMMLGSLAFLKKRNSQSSTSTLSGGRG